MGTLLPRSPFEEFVALHPEWAEFLRGQYSWDGSPTQLYRRRHEWIEEEVARGARVTIGKKAGRKLLITAGQGLRYPQRDLGDAGLTYAQFLIARRWLVESRLDI